MSRIDEYFKKRTKDISFIELKKGSQIDINGYKIYDDTPLPILTESLVEEVKTGNPEEEVRFSNMVDGIIYILGVDPEFKYAEQYKRALYSYDEKIEDYIKHRGLDYVQKGKIDEAIICFRALKTLNDKDNSAIYSYAISLEERAKLAYELEDKKLGNSFLKEALSEMEKIAYDEIPLAYYKLGYYYKHFSEFRKSKLMWEKFLRLGKEKELIEEIREQLELIEDEVVYEEGYTKVIEGYPAEGIELLLPLAEKYENWWNLSFMLGLGYRQLDKVEEAISYFEEVIKINPAQIDTLNELGLCYASKLELDKAIEFFSEAIKIEPKNYEIICNRGMAYLQLNQIEEAEIDINRAYKLNPNDEVVLACKKIIDENQ
jgi:tetratricopeptide (TPR) repeat protein